MALQRDEAELALPTRRGSKYCAEMVKLFQMVDRTPSSDWASLSVTLTHALRCLETHIDVAAEALPEPALLSRAILKCLDSQGVMGVHRKALDLLHRLAESNGIAVLLRQTPLLMAGVLDLVPRCSMQLKCEVLYFVKAHLVRALPQEVVVVELPGLIEAVIGGIDENERTEIYRVSMSLMHSIHQVMETVVVGNCERDSFISKELCQDMTHMENEEGVLLRQEAPQEEPQEEKKHPTEELRGDAFVYRALWMALRNSPSVRGAVLLYLRRYLPNASSGVSNSNSDELNTITSVSTPSQLTFVGGDVHLAQCAIFATLQAPCERIQRLMLDVLIGGFPLGESLVFNFAEQSLLVAAAVQLLGLPGTPSSIRRRVTDWLLGPEATADTNIVREVSSLRVTEALHGVVRWWESRTSDAAATAGAKDSLLLYYDVLFASARARTAQDSSGDDVNEGMNGVDLAGGESDSTAGVDLLPITWIRSLTHLFHLTGSTEMHEDHTQHHHHYGNTNNSNNNDDESGGVAVEGLTDSAPLRSPFLEHIAPLAMPYVCELLVSMELRRRDVIANERLNNNNNSSSSSSNSSVIRMSSPVAIDAMLSRLFEVVPWFYFTQYKRGIVSLLCKAAAERLEDAAHDTKASLELSRDVQQWFLQLNGMTSILVAHLIGNNNNGKSENTSSERGLCPAPEGQMALFHRDVLSLCHSLCDAIAVSCAAAAASPSVAACDATKLLIIGCLNAFDVVFGTFTTPGAGDTEEALLCVLLDATVALATALSHSPAYGDAFECMGSTTFALLSRQRPRGGACGAECGEALRRWIDAVAAVACGSSSAGDEAALRLYVDVLQLDLLPDVLCGVVQEECLTARLAPRLWRLLGRGGATQTHRIADLLVQLHALPGGRGALDAVSAEATAANGARLVLLFRVLADRGAPLDLFAPARLALLRALRTGGPLRAAAQALARQSVPAPERLLGPAAAALAAGGVAPAEFARIVADAAAAAGSAWLETLARAPPPRGLAQQTEHNSALAALVHTLLDLASRGLGKQEEEQDEEAGEQPWGDLCVEACEALNTLLGLCLRHPHPLAAAVDVWRSVSVRVASLLRDAVARGHAAAQVLLLRYILDAGRPPSILDEAALNETIESVDAALTSASEAALRQEEDMHDLLAVWSSALLEILQLAVADTKAAGERILSALVRRVDAVLLSLAAESPPDAVAALSAIEKCIGTIYAVIELLLPRPTPDNTHKSSHSEHDTHKSPHTHNNTVPLSGGASAKRGGIAFSWFNFLSFSSSSPSAEPADLSLVSGAVHGSMGLVVSTLCRAHNDARVVRQTSLGDASVAAARVESVVCDVLRLLASAAEREFVRVYIEVWAAEHVESLVVQTAAEAATAVPVACDDLLAPPSPNALALWHRNAMAALLAVGADVSAPVLLRTAGHLLAQARAGGGLCGALAEVPFDVFVFSFVRAFLRAVRVSRDEGPTVLHALLGLITTHLVAGAASTPAFQIILQTLADFDAPTPAALSSEAQNQAACAPPSGAASAFLVSGAGEARAEGAGKDKRFAVVICRTLEHFGSGPLHLSGDVAGVLSALRALVAALPVLASHPPGDQDRIAAAALAFYRRALLPTILHCTDAISDGEVRARAPLLCAALAAAYKMLFLGDAVLRRLRQELLDTLFKHDFFRFTRDVVREWARVFARATQDRAFHAAAAQLFAPSSSPSSRLAALVHSTEDEERQSLRQLRRLAFYAFSAPAQLHVTDREFALLLRERIAETLRAFPRTPGVRRPPSYTHTRHALFLFRVLLVRAGPASLRLYWPIVLPEVIRALTTASPASEAGSDGTAEAVARRELLSLQMECLKLLDFILVIAPDVFASYRWVFFDDMGPVSFLGEDTTAHHAEKQQDLFVPFITRIADSHTMPCVPPTTGVHAAPNAKTHAERNWSGRQRPLLRIPQFSCGDMCGVQTCAAALSAFSRAHRVSVGGEEWDKEAVGTHTRLMDGWDEAYVRELLEMDFSCTADE